ncbi:MAG: hypothetical protein Kow0022_05120 [Phycisphaerales bacterium]
MSEATMRTALFGRDGVRRVQCYHCGHEQDAPARAQTISCVKCFRQLSVPDIVVRALHWGGSLRTCGCVTVHKRARVVCQSLVAVGDVIVHGHLEADVRAGGAVYVGPEAFLKGSVRAGRLIVEPGAEMVGGPFVVPGSLIDPVRATSADANVRAGAAA